MDYSKYDLTHAVEDYQLNKISNMQKFSWKAELKSFLITFAVGFALVIYDQLDNFTLETFKNGAYLGVLMGAIRAGIKGVIEMFLRVYNK